MTDIVERLRDPRERFIFQGGSEFAVGLADEIASLRSENERLRATNIRLVDNTAVLTTGLDQLRAENAALKAERDRWREDSQRQTATIQRLADAATDRDEVDRLRHAAHAADVVSSEELRRARDNYRAGYEQRDKQLAALRAENAALKEENRELGMQVRDVVAGNARLTQVMTEITADCHKLAAERDALKDALEKMVRPGNSESLGTMTTAESHEWGRRVLANAKHARELLDAIDAARGLCKCGEPIHPNIPCSEAKA